MTCPDFATDARLCPSARIVGQYLQRLVRRCYTDCLCSSKTIGRKLGLSARTVQAAIRALSDLGFVEVVRDYGLRTRRRIRLLWRVAVGLPTLAGAMAASLPPPEPVPNASVSADTGAECQLEFALTNPSPPDPPYKVSEDTTERGDDDPAGAGDPAYGHPAPAEPVVVASPALPVEEEPIAAPVPAELIAQAEQILGAGPGTVGRIRYFARQYTPDWVRRALGIAQAKARKEKGPVGMGYLRRTLEGFAAEGGPPEEPPARGPKPQSPEERARLQATLTEAARAQARRDAAEAARVRGWEDLPEERREEIRAETRRRFPGMSEQAREVMARSRAAEVAGGT